VAELVLTVVAQANALAPNWGQTIFQSANEILVNSKMRSHVNEIQTQVESEKQWWEKRRDQIQTDFMKELDGSEKSSTKHHSEDEAVLVDTPSKKAAKAGKGGKK
jgi:translocation protein SEC66